LASSIFFFLVHNSYLPLFDSQLDPSVPSQFLLILTRNPE
jgi:hypothetical protein